MQLVVIEVMGREVKGGMILSITKMNMEMQRSSYLIVRHISGNQTGFN